MPPVAKYIFNPNTPEAKYIEDMFSQELAARQQVYAQRWDYYYGNHRRHLAPDASNTDDNLIVNMVELGIDKSVGKVMGLTDEGGIKGPDFDVPAEEKKDDTEKPKPNVVQRAVNGVKSMMRPPKPEEKSEERKWLDQFWEANQKSVFLHDVALNGAICGHIFVKIVPDGVPDPDEPAKRLPRVISLNPGNVTAFWEWGDVDRVLFYRIQYGGMPSMSGAMGPRSRQDIVRAVSDDGEDEGYWLIRDFEEVANQSGWRLVREDTWDYTWSPVVEWKNLPRPNEHYGLDDVRRNPNLNDGLNFTMSNIQRIIKYHAAPNTVITGAQANELQETGIDRLWALSPAEAKVYNVEMQSDLASSMAHAMMLRQYFFDGIRELDPATVKDKIGTLTNFGLRVLFGDSLQKTGTKRLLYGYGLRCLCQYALELAGMGANRKVTDSWPDPLPRDPLSMAQALQIDRQNGLSQETYLEQRGFDPEIEKLNREQELGEQALVNTMSQQGAMLDKFRQGASAGNGAAGGRPAGMDRRGTRGNGGY
jgi:hypothetical protein